MPISILNQSALQNSNVGSIARALEEIFAQPATVERAELDLQCAFDSSRRQSHSTALLAQILEAVKDRPRDHKSITIVDVDLFIPVLTFVFGEAQLGGSAAIVSTHRLHNQFYGLQADSRLFLQRLEKEVVHELGHTFGLYHCRYFECVMRSSTYVEEIDIKRATLCSACAALLVNKAALCPG